MLDSVLTTKKWLLLFLFFFFNFYFHLQIDNLVPTEFYLSIEMYFTSEKRATTLRHVPRHYLLGTKKNFIYPYTHTHPEWLMHCCQVPFFFGPKNSSLQNVWSKKKWQSGIKIWPRFTMFVFQYNFSFIH